MNKITLSSSYNFVSGYAEILEVLLKDLPLLDYDISCRTYTTVSDRFKKYFHRDNVQSRSDVDLFLYNIVNEFSVGNPYIHMNFDRPRILLTMWESTRINDLLIEILNKFSCIIVPNNYNKINLINQGCSTRIEVVPLFCDTEFYTYNDHVNRDKVVFGISNEDPRKNLDKLQTAFIKAFTKEKNVELHIKTSNFNGSRKTIKSNIQYINRLLSKDQLKDWYNNIDVYISGTSCEGWGMMQQESMCCGRPIIYTHYGGLCEFVDKRYNYPVKFKEVPAQHFWGDYGGKWSEFDEDDLIDKMKYCYNNMDQVRSNGYFASVEASKFSKLNFLKKIDSILKNYL